MYRRAANYLPTVPASAASIADKWLALQTAEALTVKGKVGGHFGGVNQ